MGKATVKPDLTLPLDADRQQINDLTIATTQLLDRVAVLESIIYKARPEPSRADAFATLSAAIDLREHVQRSDLPSPGRADLLEYLNAVITRARP